MRGFNVLSSLSETVLVSICRDETGKMLYMDTVTENFLSESVYEIPEGFDEAAEKMYEHFPCDNESRKNIRQ
ncbi:hypothetical protein JC794_04275 [Morganella morganii]|uniref:hypothetical protein n=1 Tax=Morganella morganii TaxID=582 RepID=UPI000D1DAD37|nr:hypothetical protein [Morganella morganii]HAE78336.1 hypothetical protein [Morganella sp. (in: enterobacteria)]QXO43467.1 hypothetical protein CXB74_004125 [Morganella morganii]QXO47059.1 hypothetical protein JC862_04020 [Morganella morganii]QXO50828.1 hypothetical protein JC861_04135 [Morganella morganii]QXO54694.1 hypothetical protein JC830_04135 [Morganella morganii]